MNLSNQIFLGNDFENKIFWFKRLWFGASFSLIIQTEKKIFFMFYFAFYRNCFFEINKKMSKQQLIKNNKYRNNNSL